MRLLSKSKRMGFRQCPKRLWLSIHRPKLSEKSAGAQARFRVGFEVAEVARRLYDPEGTGTVLDTRSEGYDAALDRTQAHLQDERPIFERGLRAPVAVAFADMLLPVKARTRRSWRIVEVKSCTTAAEGFNTCRFAAASDSELWASRHLSGPPAIPTTTLWPKP